MSVSPTIAIVDYGMGNRRSVEKAFAHVGACPDDVLGTAEYGGERFASAVGREHVFGVQLHPEKSSRAGLRLLASFAAACEREGAAA